MSSLTNPTPQFSTAEFQGGPDRCQLCGQTLGSTYYRIGQKQACPACAEKAKFDLPKDTHSAFVRGMIFGIGGAILGLIAYSAFTIITGIEIGYLSLLVGFLVAKAILMGSKGIGGRRYQVTALLLTYAGVSLSAIPIGISMYLKQEEAKKTAAAQSSAHGRPEVTAPKVDDDKSSTEASSANPPAQQRSLGGFLGYILLMGLASPFLELENPVSGALGIIILLVGIRIAWQMTAGKSVEILGPFNRSSASATPSVPG